MSAPTVAPEIQQEAARTLVERLGEKNKLVRFFRYNASAKHGVPIDPDNGMVYPIGQSTTNDNTTTTNTTTNTSGGGGQGGVVPNSVTTGHDRDRDNRGTAMVDIGQTPNQQPNISVNVAAPTATPSPTTSGNDLLKGIVYTLAALAGLGGVGALGYVLGRPSAPTPAVQAEQKVQQSPLQFLEDMGAHLPPGSPKATEKAEK